jgi:hypothetical protein
MLLRLYRLTRLYLLPSLALALTCTTARAASVLEQAQLQVFIVDVYLSTVVDICAQKQPELRQQLLEVRQAFHQRLRHDIERGREVGRALAESRGKDIDQEAKRIADQNATKDFQTAENPKTQRLCGDLLLKKNNPALWSIDDFLRQDYESLQMEVGNRQGLPCRFIPGSFESIARRFLELRGPSSEPLDVATFFLISQINPLAKKTSNCLAVQTRAAEYRVAPDKDLEVIEGLLSSMEAVLMPMLAPRDKKVESFGTVSERVAEYLRQRGEK